MSASGIEVTIYMRPENNALTIINPQVIDRAIEAIKKAALDDNRIQMDSIDILAVKMYLVLTPERVIASNDTNSSDERHYQDASVFIPTLF